jgi:histone deacetylase 1/2
MDNANTKDYLDKIRNQVVENLKRTAFAPSVQMTDVPRNPILDGMDDEADDVLDDLDEDENKDKRFTQRRFDQYVEKPGELSDSEDEEVNAANGVRRQPGTIRRRNQTNYRNIDAADSGLDSGMATPLDASSIADNEMDSALDAKMTDVPMTESGAVTGAEGQDTPMADSERMAVEGEDNGTSAAVSQQPSPPALDEDTAMEDAVAVAEEAELPGALDTQDEKKREVSSAADETIKAPLSPSGAQPVSKESSVPAADASATEPAPATGDSESKPASGVTTEEPTKKEE